MEIQGKLLEISDTVQVKDTFRKREFVVEYADNPQYPEFVKFECIQDKCDLLDDFSVGQEATVSFNLKGRKWIDPQGNTKYFNSLQAWRIQPASGDTNTASPANSSNTSASNTSSNSAQDDIISADTDGEDDLPF